MSDMVNSFDLIDKAVEYALKKGCSHADVRIQRVWTTKIRTRQGTVVSATPGVSEGCGIRVLIDNSWGFASVNLLTAESVKSAVDSAVKLALSVGNDAEDTFVANAPIVEEEESLRTDERVTETPIETKIKVSLEVDELARKVSDAIKVTVTYVDQFAERYFGNSDGTRLKSDESWLFLSVTAYASEAGKIQSYRKRAGFLGGFDKLWRSDYGLLGVEAAEKALDLLKAEKAPAGRMTVVIDGELAGLLAHEAFGHASEADLVADGTSILAGKLGQQVASESVTIVDDATLEGGFGSYRYDDEGVKGQRKVIVQKGVLREFLSDRESSYRLGLPLTGNARAEGFDHPPIVRMSNTFFERGDMDVEELIEDVKVGVYAMGGRGGQVNPIEGVFQFGAQEAYLIERGRITKLVRDFSMSGFILDTLRNVSGVGRDLMLTPGFCGKNRQMVRVSSGGPHLRIENMMVGGEGWT